MLTIRAEQMRVLAAASSRELLLQHARGRHSDAVAQMTEHQLEEIVDRVIAGAIRYRLKRTTEFCRLLDLTIVFGPDWQNPELRWLEDGMTDPDIADPGQRLARLWKRALRRLAAEG